MTEPARSAIRAPVLPEAPLRLTLSKDALVANWRWLAGQGGRAACGAAVKADGYGLGARAVVDALAEAGCRDFFVATWAEAAALGPLDDALSLSVLHGVREEDLSFAIDHPARPVLNSPAMIARWREAAPGRPCDVMIDTGMNRLGLTPEEARTPILSGLRIETLMSHLACADEPAHAMNEQQLFTFRGLKGQIPARRYSLANSAGICLGRRYAFDLTRPGLALYGGRPVPGLGDAIAQVAQVEAALIQVRTVAAGQTVGYGATFTAPRAMPVGILNIGYADGYLRAWAGHGIARAGGAACLLVGRVSMDLVAVDLSAAPQAREGDWLMLDYALPAAAEATGLSQYELLTGLGPRYQRRWS